MSAVSSCKAAVCLSGPTHWHANMSIQLEAIEMFSGSDSNQEDQTHPPATMA